MSTDHAEDRFSQLTDSDLSDSDRPPIRDDLWAVLSAAPGEARAVRNALAEGRVDGTVYHGECACLIGTIAAARNCSIDQLGRLRPNSSRPAENFFTAISPGDTPATNQACALAHEWTSEWIAAMESAFAAKEATT